MPKFAAELKALGYDKWKSCGLIRYRGLRFAAYLEARAPTPLNNAMNDVMKDPVWRDPKLQERTGTQR
jgi:hypothetical protein